MTARRRSKTVRRTTSPRTASVAAARAKAKAEQDAAFEAKLAAFRATVDAMVNRLKARSRQGASAVPPAAPAPQNRGSLELARARPRGKLTDPELKACVDQHPGDGARRLRRWLREERGISVDLRTVTRRLARLKRSRG